MTNNPLMVDCLKITNWLEDRKKLHKDWYTFLKAAEDKLNILVRDHHAYLHYPNLTQYLNLNQDTFYYNDVINFTQDLLKTPLANDKTLMFGYTDKRVKQWTTLKKYMEGKLIGVLSTAKFIKQTLTFDLPAINKNIELLDSQLASLNRKIDFNNNTIYQQTKSRENQEKVLQIDASNLQPEIVRLVKSTPTIFQQYLRILEQIKIHQLIEIYKRACQQNTINLQPLEHLITYDDAFVEEYLQKNHKNNQQIKYHKNNQQIKYQQFYTWKPKGQWEIQIQGENKIKIVYKQTILSDKFTRQQLNYNLNQLLYFFKSVKFEKSSKVSTIDPQLSNLSQIYLDQALKNISDLLRLLNSQKVITALQLINNPKFYQQIIAKFNNFNMNIDQMNDQIKNCRDQIKDITKNREVMVQKLTYLRNKVLIGKVNCQNWLTQFIKRQVRITGEINKLQ